MLLETLKGLGSCEDNIVERRGRNGGVSRVFVDGCIAHPLQQPTGGGGYQGWEPDRTYPSSRDLLSCYPSGTAYFSTNYRWDHEIGKSLVMYHLQRSLIACRILYQVLPTDMPLLTAFSGPWNSRICPPAGCPGSWNSRHLKCRGKASGAEMKHQLKFVSRFRARRATRHRLPR